MTKPSTSPFLTILYKFKETLLYLLIYCLVQQRVYQSRVHEVEELFCFTFGTAFNRVQLIAQLMESASSRLRTGRSKEDILTRVLKMQDVKMMDIKMQDMKLLHILAVLLCYISDRMFNSLLSTNSFDELFFKIAICF